MTATSEKTKRILIVDDEPDICVYLTKLFQEHGYVASSAADGNQALDTIRKDRPDLITLDLSMPHKSGVKFYREIRSNPEFEGVPVVFVTGVTGFGGDADATERFYASRRQMPAPQGFVAKPIDAAEILELVGKLISR